MERSTIDVAEKMNMEIIRRDIGELISMVIILEINPDKPGEESK